MGPVLRGDNCLRAYGENYLRACVRSAGRRALADARNCLPGIAIRCELATNDLAELQLASIPLRLRVDEFTTSPGFPPIALPGNGTGSVIVSP